MTTSNEIRFQSIHNNSLERSYPQFDLARFLSYILVMTYPKIIFLALVVSEEIDVKVFGYFFALSFNI